MNTIEGIIRIEYLNAGGLVAGIQNGLIMSYYDQTVIFTPFKIDKTHFTHLKNAVCMIDNKVIELNESRFVHPYLLRIWTIKYIGINPVSELTINFPKKNHYINDTKLDVVNDNFINMWHIILPPIYAHEISTPVEIGSIIHFNNKVTGMVVTHFQNKSIIINTYTLKQLINGQDYYYANLYYGLSLNEHKQFYVKEDWDQYENCLIKNDIILEIEDVPISMYMYFERFNKDIYIDAWITCMFMEKDNEILRCKIIRDEKIINIKIPRKPLSILMQIPYYSDDVDQVSFENLSLNSTNERLNKIGNELKKNPRKLFV